MLYRFLSIVFMFVYCHVQAKTKPVEGVVVSDSSRYLSGVSIVSLPSSSSTKTNAEGSFYFDIPVDDKKITFNLSGYASDTINAVLYKNDSKVVLKKIIQVNYLDSINTKIRFVLSRGKKNEIVFVKNDLSNRGIFTTEDMIRYDSRVIFLNNQIDQLMFYVKGFDVKNMRKLYNNLRVDYLRDPTNSVNVISNQGLSQITITSGGFNKVIASPGLINFSPSIDYKNEISLNIGRINENGNNEDGFATLATRYASLNGGFGIRENNILSIKDSLKTTVLDNNYSEYSNIAITNRRNLEIILSGFSNRGQFLNPAENDTSESTSNNIMLKVDQWSPLTGRISLFGSNQQLYGTEKNSINHIRKNDKCSSLGFLFENDIDNFLFTFSTVSTLINSDWVIGEKRLQMERQVSLFTGSTQIFFNKPNSGMYIKYLKMIFSKERTADVPDVISTLKTKPNYWDLSSFQFSTSMAGSKNLQRSFYLDFGIYSSVPDIENTIKTFSGVSLFGDSLDVLPQKHSTISFGTSAKKVFKKYNWAYSFDIDFFDHFYNDKRNHVPILGSKTTYPMNIGDVRLSGFTVQFQLEPYARRLKLASHISTHRTNDFSKFQFLSKNVVDNEITFLNRYFNITLKVTSSGKRFFKVISEEDLLLNYEFSSQKSYMLKASRTFVFRWFHITTSFSGENLNVQPIQIGNIMTNERKYFLDVNLVIK